MLCKLQVFLRLVYCQSVLALVACLRGGSSFTHWPVPGALAVAV